MLPRLLERILGEIFKFILCQYFSPGIQNVYRETLNSGKIMEYLP